MTSDLPSAWGWWRNAISAWCPSAASARFKTWLQILDHDQHKSIWWAMEIKQIIKESLSGINSPFCPFGGNKIYQHSEFIDEGGDALKKALSHRQVGSKICRHQTLPSCWNTRRRRNSLPFPRLSLYCWHITQASHYLQTSLDICSQWNSPNLDMFLPYAKWFPTLESCAMWSISLSFVLGTHTFPSYN